MLIITLRVLLENKFLLDLGCGTGYGTHELSLLAKDIVGIDIWRKGLIFCHKKYCTRKTSFLRGSGCNLAFKDNSFDLVISFQVIEHIPPILVIEYLKEIKRVLKVNGTLMIATPNKRIRLLPFQKPWNKDHIKEYDSRSLKRLLKSFFTKVDIQGLFAKKEIYMVEYNRVKQNILLTYIAQPLSSILHLFLPTSYINKLKKILIKHYFLPTQLSIKHSNPNFSLEDFQTSKKNLNSSIDLYAICTK